MNRTGSSIASLLLTAALIMLSIALSACETYASPAYSPDEKSQGTIIGVVLDQEDSRPLPGVNIVIRGTRLGTVTNRKGEFVFSNIPAGTYALVFEFIGFAALKRDNIRVEDQKIYDLGTLMMAAQPIPLKEVVVSPGSYALMGDQASIRQTLTSEDIHMMGWAEDITRAVQRIPGISATDFSAKFSIRGGDVDEVLVLLDGMQIYKPFHQKDFGGGLFSTVDIETIEGVDLLTGGFTADYGDRMSGVLNMQTKSARKGERKTSVGFSLMNARLFSMGALKSGKGSWMVSARRGYLDILNSLMKNEFKLKPTYYDVLGKAEYQLSQNQSLSIYGFLANDAYKLDEKEIEKGKTRPNIDFVDTQYGNSYGWLTLKSSFTPQLYARTILYGGAVTQNRFWNRFDDDPNAHLNTATIDDNRDFKLFGLKQDWDFEATPGLFLRFGVDLKRLNVTYDYSNSIMNEFITADDSLVSQATSFDAATKRDGNQAGLYLASRFKLLPRFTVETGMRYDHASYAGDNLWSPRVNLVATLAKATFLRAGWGYFYQSQGIDELNIQFGDLAYHPAQRAEHFVLGFDHRLNNGLQLRAEGYYKKMSDLRDAYYSFRDIDELFPEGRDDLIGLSFNSATAQGMELFLKYDTGKKLSWWLSYVLSDVKDDIRNINYEGRLIRQTGSLPRVWDQRHTVNIDANYRLNKSWHFHLAWQYRSGWPLTDFTVQRKQRDDGTFAYYHDYGVFRGSRFPNYQRMDTRINRHFHTGKGKISIFLHIINLYNHENISAYDHEIREQSQEGFQHTIENETFFGILPFIGFSWEF